MDADAEDPVKGGGRCADVGDILQVCGPGSSPLWLLNMGSDPPHGPDAGTIIAQGGILDNRETNIEATQRRMGIPPLREAVR